MSKVIKWWNNTINEGKKKKTYTFKKMIFGWET
jgi:hypothetical protein